MGFFSFFQRDRTDEVLAALAKLSQQLTKTRSDIMATIQNVIAAVEAEKTVEDSAVALLQGLSAKIQALIDAQATPEQFQAVVDEVNANAAALAAAVTANTPAAP